MPSSARKSSLGGAARRGLQKAHIPYRGDNPEVGKKTGIAVQHVERKSDGFEPFEELLQQAPSPPRRKKKSVGPPDRRYDDYDDDDGEQSMQLDSPDFRQLMNIRPPSTPSTAGRHRSSIRPVARTSDVDFDQIPSPRPLSSQQRSARNGAAGPSSLRKSFAPQGSPSASESDNEPAGDYSMANYDDTMDQSGFDDYGAQEDTERTPRQSNYSVQSNFSRIEEEEDEEEEEEEEEQEPEEEQPPREESTPISPPPSRSEKPSSRHEKPLSRAEKPISRNDRNKKSSRQETPPYQEEQVEDEIAKGLEDVDMADSAEESEQEPQPPAKKVKGKPPSPAKKKPGPKTATRNKKENREPREGVRRSRRPHIAPLEYWRGEKLVYGRSNNMSGPVLVPPIKEVLRIPKEIPAPLGSKGAKRKRASTRPRSRSRTVAEPDSDYVIPPALPVVNPEEGWDDGTTSQCTVLHYTTKEEVERRIAWTAKMVSPRMSADHNWSFDKIFGDDDFIAAGQLVIPPGCRKPSKAAKDNTYVFYVIEGAINLKIHETSMVLCTGGMFLVPRGNNYLIENICNRDAKLFFTQARKVSMSPEEEAAKRAELAEIQRRRSMMRSSSAGVPTRSTSANVNGRAVSFGNTSARMVE
ncbi:hypothetical protein D9613_002538 [Agrocybe pediades]|uniref:CENP-C homolog n=1 Tax=Agrocybe pediades TaxID=84607 RepID=A0A8H4QQ92_9AGAR|nr:hypothetical protein D9613_002538 [Agrocybe pediades]